MSKNRFDVAGLYWSTCDHCNEEILSCDDGCSGLCSSCVEDIHEYSTCTVFRGLRDNENAANGIIAKNPDANFTLQNHISGAANTQFISTSLDIKAAIYFSLRGYFSGNNHALRVVEVQVLIDESESFYRDNYLQNFSFLDCKTRFIWELSVSLGWLITSLREEVCFSRRIDSNEIVKVYHLPSFYCNEFRYHLTSFGEFLEHYNNSSLETWVIAEQQSPISVVMKSLLDYHIIPIESVKVK